MRPRLRLSGKRELQSLIQVFARTSAARVKKEGLDIRLVEVDDLLHGKSKG